MWSARRTRGLPIADILLRRLAVAAGAILLAAGATAAELEAPRVILSQVNWAEAAASLSDHGIDPPAEEFARLNRLTGRRFPGIDKSSVPVLLPFDVDRFRADIAAGRAEAAMSTSYSGPFRGGGLFVPGPAGYTATFFIDSGAGGIEFTYRKPVEIEITGAAFTYDLDGPEHQEVFPARELDDSFPGIRRILRDAHLRYAFERFGVPYVVSIQCYDRPRARRYLSCKEADPIALRFLRLLRTVGGSPLPIGEPHVDLAEPEALSADFTYFGPGDLIPGTGWHKMPGRVDRHVYAEMRFPIAQAPAYVKSQSFMPWGDCYRSGHDGYLGKKGAHYSCRVNGMPLVFDESAAANFTYPWRDNFCELRDFLVGQCPGGHGHQGEDIRPANCVLLNAQADRCLPYQHEVVAARDGVIWRNPGNLAVYIVVNTENDFVRLRYMHMNPHFMDADGLLSGRRVSRGEVIGKVGTWGDYENGTSYHLHFNIQVFTKAGWVWVNPYMTLVLAYERMIGARGTEIGPGETPPPVPDKPPIIVDGEPAADPAANAVPETAPQHRMPPSTGHAAKVPKRHVHRRIHRTHPHRRRRHEPR